MSIARVGETLQRATKVLKELYWRQCAMVHFAKIALKSTVLILLRIELTRWKHCSKIFG